MTVPKLSRPRAHGNGSRWRGCIVRLCAALSPVALLVLTFATFLRLGIFLGGLLAGDDDGAAPSRILHVAQSGPERTATTLQFNVACACLFLSVREYSPELLVNTFCDTGGWGDFYQHARVPQAIKTHSPFPAVPFAQHDTTLVFTTARTKAEAVSLGADLEQKGYRVGLVQDLETLSDIGVRGMVEQYAGVFGIEQEIESMAEYFELWEIMRVCCGLQMSKYWRNELLPRGEKTDDLKPHPFCNSTDIDEIERKFIDTPLYRLIDQYKHARSINKPSMVDGALDGTYCSRYNADVTRMGYAFNEPGTGYGWEQTRHSIYALKRLVRSMALDRNYSGESADR